MDDAHATDTLRDKMSGRPVHQSVSTAVVPVALFGIDNEGFGIAANLLVILLIAIWFALTYWTLADARRRLEDPVLIGSAALAALIFPFAGSLVYAIVRPPETLDDGYERDLDIRAAELRVRLLEQAVKTGPGAGQFAATVAGEIAGEQAGRHRGVDPATERRPERGASGQSAQVSSAKSPEHSRQSGDDRSANAAAPAPAPRRSEPSAEPLATRRPSQSPRTPGGRPTGSG